MQIYILKVTQYFWMNVFKNLLSGSCKIPFSPRISGKTEVKLVLLTDIDKLLMFEKGIRQEI